MTSHVKLGCRGTCRQWWSLKEGSNRSFQVFYLYWRMPESGDLWYISRQRKRRFDLTWFWSAGGRADGGSTGRGLQPSCFRGRDSPREGFDTPRPRHVSRTSTYTCIYTRMRPHLYHTIVGPQCEGGIRHSPTSSCVWYVYLYVDLYTDATTSLPHNCRPTI